MTADDDCFFSSPRCRHNAAAGREPMLSRVEMLDNLAMGMVSARHIQQANQVVVLLGDAKT
jgi:hypothetical protein